MQVSQEDDSPLYVFEAVMERIGNGLLGDYRVPKGYLDQIIAFLSKYGNYHYY
jgi:hypothetical protein